MHGNGPVPYRQKRLIGILRPGTRLEDPLLETAVGHNLEIDNANLSD